MIATHAIRQPLAPSSFLRQRAGVWVLVAAYNEGERLGATLAALCDEYANVVVVDDGSRDDTSEVASRYPVWLLQHLVNCGQGAALQTAIDFALRQGAEILVTFDADGQHVPEDIDRLVDAVRAGRGDMVLGSRFLGRAAGVPWSRWLVLRLGVLFTRLFSHIRVTDTHNGLRAMSRHAAQRIHITLDRMAHASEILDQIRLHGLGFCEVPVTIRYSPATLAKGQSSWNAFKIVGQLVLGRLIR
ncbi:MAG TPA: glycosyltransferase family 2 protein [Gemmataceae bacterium]|jgi:glycosyltransferase involved in cell wall biosynthesis|nr:glycosyltransferase family 2 protein [Gemmataceae bacterium]